ncbi:ATP-binding protein [bacterium]|nr:ATP-binding protein [bacterium]MBU1635103.1 ATP-binding protein [bacterium]MBU1872137.1 ATP-binding protein [bacterium]
MTELVSFQPTKKLFIDILTRDITIRDCILELLDNAVDSYTRNEIDEKREIRLNFDKNELSIFDNCGGIDKKKLQEEVFRFGTKDFLNNVPTIGLYGIGLKRSIFKLGELIVFETDDGKDYCKLEIDVNDWLKKKDEEGNDIWDIELTETSTTRLIIGQKPYTKIKVKNLRYETKETFIPKFETDLKETVKIYYSRYIQKDKIDFFVNNEKQRGFEIKVKTSDDFKPVRVEDEHEGIKITIFCWLDLKEDMKRKEKEPGRQGWNVFMNERLVIFDDTSEDTGWTGERAFLPKFHSLYNDFMGVVFLNTNDPSKLPINTSKNGFNKEGKVYHHLLNLMVKVARPFIDFLSDKYDKQKEKIDEKIDELLKDISKDREEEKGIIETSIDDSKTEYQSTFTPPEIVTRPVIPQTRISFYKPKRQVDIMKKVLGVRTNWEVGEKTFDYFWESEGLDEKE